MATTPWQPGDVAICVDDRPPTNKNFKGPRVVRGRAYRVVSVATISPMGRKGNWLEVSGYEGWLYKQSRFSKLERADKVFKDQVRKKKVVANGQ